MTGKVLALDTSRMTLKEIDGVTIHTNDQALVYVDSLDDQDVNLQNRLITPKGGELHDHAGRWDESVGECGDRDSLPGEVCG